jgi:hypothetical protein
LQNRKLEIELEEKASDGLRHLQAATIGGDCNDCGRSEDTADGILIHSLRMAGRQNQAEELSILSGII